MGIVIEFESAGQGDDIENTFREDDRIGFIHTDGIVVIKESGKVVFRGVPVTQDLVPAAMSGLAVVGVYILFRPGMAGDIADNRTVIDDRKDDIVRVARIEPAGYPDREILVIVETEAAPLQIRMPESALVKVRQFDRHQFVVYFFRLVLLQQVQVQRCGNVSCLQNHQVHATDSRQKLLQCTGGCPAGEAVGHERPAVGSRLADVDTELTARLSAERAARNDKVLTAPVPFGTRLAGYLRNQILIFLYRQFHIKV